MFLAKTIASASLATAAGLVGVNLLGVAVDQYFEQYRDVARLTCNADVMSYPKSYQAAAEQACLTKKMAALDDQQAPIKKITGMLGS